MAQAGRERTLIPVNGALPRTQRTAARTAAPRRVLIVGAGARGQDIAQELLDDGRHRYEVIGFADDVAELACIEGLRVLGGFDDVLALVEAHRVDEVILAYAPSWQE